MLFFLNFFFCVCTCVWRFTCPCVCREVNILFPIAHPPSFLKPGAFSQTGVHGVPGWHACFCTGTWNSNSGSHPCAADTLPTELPPSLSLSFLTSRKVQNQYRGCYIQLCPDSRGSMCSDSLSSALYGVYIAFLVKEKVCWKWEMILPEKVKKPTIN